MDANAAMEKQVDTDVCGRPMEMRWVAKRGLCRHLPISRHARKKGPPGTNYGRRRNDLSLILYGLAFLWVADLFTLITPWPHGLGSMGQGLP